MSLDAVVTDEAKENEELCYESLLPRTALQELRGGRMVNDLTPAVWVIGCCEGFHWSLSGSFAKELVLGEQNLKL